MVVVGCCCHLSGAGSSHAAADLHVVAQHQRIGLPHHFGQFFVSFLQGGGVGSDHLVMAGVRRGYRGAGAGSAGRAAGAAIAGGAGAVFFGLVLGDQLREGLLVFHAQQLLFQIRHLDNVLGFVDLLFQLSQPGGIGGGFLFQLRGCKLVLGIQHLLFEVCQILLIPCGQHLLFGFQHPGVVLGQFCFFQLSQLFVVLRVQLLLFSRAGLCCVLGIQLRLRLCLFGFGLLGGLPRFSILV